MDTNSNINSAITQNRENKNEEESKITNKQDTTSDQQKYYEDTRTRDSSYTDELGYYRVKMQDHINFRYEPIRILGKGGYGLVVEAVDHKNKIKVAVKVLRNNIFVTYASAQEIFMNQYISKYYLNLPIPSVVKMIESFVFRNHTWIVFELLYCDLYEFMEINYCGLPFPVKDIVKSMLIGLLHIHDANIVHNDIKPKNIMLTCECEPFIKIIDFGLAQIGRQQFVRTVQTLTYRSPEVILHLPYGPESDIWSLGCVVAELISGLTLFAGFNEAEQLGLFMEILGLPPKELVTNSPVRDRYFITEGHPKYSATSELNDSYALNEEFTESLRGVLPGSSSLLYFVGSDQPNELLDFLEKCLAWLPEKRLDVRGALNHPWISGTLTNLEQSVIHDKRLLNIPKETI